MNYPDFQTYRSMYVKYFQKGAGQLFLRDVSGMRVLDLCGGDGRATMEALKRGASHVTYVDLEPAMTPEELRNDERIRVFNMSVHDYFFQSPCEQFDFVICQQAINYWFNYRIIPYLVSNMKKGGVFVFNTFNVKPSEDWTVKEYEIDGVKFHEMHSLDQYGYVDHVQNVDGFTPHVTRFRWIAPEEFNKVLKMNFTTTTPHISGSTTIWECTK